MATSLAKINIHLIFHVKSTSVKVREGDLPRLFAYIGGIIRSLGTTVIEVGGMPDHVHILTTLPKMMAPADFVRTIKAESSKWLKTLAPPLRFICVARGIRRILRQSVATQHRRALHSSAGRAPSSAFVSRGI